MREALDAFVIRGVASNIPFQAALLAHPEFVAGDFNTGFIAEHYAGGFRAEDVAHDDPRLPASRWPRRSTAATANARPASAASCPATARQIGERLRRRRPTASAARIATCR